MKKLTSKKKIKNHLWQNGYRVKEPASNIILSDGVPGVFYDLLVDDKIRVCVIGFTTQKLSDCDVIAAVNGQKKRYRFNQEPVKWQTITKIFGTKKRSEKKVKK